MDSDGLDYYSGETYDALPAYSFQYTLSEIMSAAIRAGFVLRHFEQMAVREVAAQLSISESSVKQAVLRAVRKLRHALAEHQELVSHA